MLSELAATEPFSFKAIVDVTRLQQRQYDSHKNQQQLLQEARDAHDDKGDDEVDVITPAEKAAWYIETINIKSKVRTDKWKC